MPVIYEPKGKAKEYCDLAVNLYRGCDHGCLYCYAPNVLFLSREEFHNPEPRKNILENLKKEAAAYAGKEILLCFTCDPYQKIDTKYQITRKAIQILIDSGVYVNILTKGGQRSIRDFDLLTNKSCKYGTTLTFTKDIDSVKYEPGATLPGERIDALKIAKLTQGIQTWVSLEPVIDPAQTLEIIEITSDYVDLYKVGKWNYDKEALKIDWKKFLQEVLDKLAKLNKNFYIKNDLKGYL